MLKPFFMKIKFYIPAFLWALVILAMLCIPGQDLARINFWDRIPQFDKLVHWTLFLGLGFLIYCGRFRSAGRICNAAEILTMALFAFLFGAFTEWVQQLIPGGRISELADFAADIAGTIAGLLSIHATAGRMMKKYEM